MFKRLFTKNLTEIPLLWITFNYKHFKDKGKEGSCIIKLHPNLRADQHVINTLYELIDYIRDNYDMKNM